ncbi:MAG: hypothetical protein AB8I08_11645 [Sandaracinaceae bacterium]
MIRLSTRIATLVSLLTVLGGCAVDASKGTVPDVTAGKADGSLVVTEHGDLTWDEQVDAELAEGQGHAWTFTLDGPAEVSFGTSGGEFSVDTVVYLHDGADELAVDDDGGEGYYSQLDASLEAGTYKVTVAGYADAAGPFNLVGSCAGEGCGEGGVTPTPSDDPWALAHDVNRMHVEFTDATPIPESYSRPDGVGPVSLSSPEWWQRWSGGATQSFSWGEGTDYGKRCGQASAIRLQAIFEYEETDADGNVTYPGREAFDNLRENSGWGGTMYNWTEDISEGGRPSFSPASMWAWRTSAVKFINVVHPDGSCDLPTLDLVQRFSATCLAQAEGNDGAIQGCRATAN